MKMKTRRILAVMLGAIVVLAPSATWAQSAGSAFTYQGQLREGGVPADGSYDFRFTLYDNVGTVVGGPISIENWLVDNGLFSVILDFGSSPFTGDARFLEIGVRPGDSGTVVTYLTPRQELTPTPYASTALQTVGVDGHSLDAADGTPADAVYVDSSGEVGIGTLAPNHPLHAVSSSTASAIMGENTSASSLGQLGNQWSGVYGEVPNGYGVSGRVDVGSGVFGESTAGTGWVNGIEGYTYSPDGNAVYGYSEAESGIAAAVRGDSIHGFGGYFVGNGYFSNRLGIGTTTLTSTLTVDGPIESLAGGFIFPDGTVQTTAASGGGTSYWTPSTSGIFYDDGYVGVGVEYPQFSLHVIDPVATAIGGQCIGEGTEGYLGHEFAGVYGYGPTAISGVSSSTSGRAVEGLATATSGTTYGVHGTSNSNYGRGVYGEVTGTGGRGVFGRSVGGSGVYGEATGTSGWLSGVEGYAMSPGGAAVYGFNEAETGNATAIMGEVTSPDGFGGWFYGRGYFSNSVGIGTTDTTSTLTVAGPIESTATGFKFPDGTVQDTAATGGGLWQQSGSDIYYEDGWVGIGTTVPDYALHVVDGFSSAIVGENPSESTMGQLGSEWAGVYGEATTGRAVQGSAMTSGAVTNYGVYGEAAGDSGYGVYGEALGSAGYGVYGKSVGGFGVYGNATGTSGYTRGVHARAQSPDGYGLFAANYATSGYAIAIRGDSSSPDGFAGYFVGRGHFSGDVGIGTTTPTEKLHVNGTVRMNGLKLGTSATAGHVLTTDANGVGTWQESPEFTLPFSGSVSSTGPAFSVTNTGTGVGSHGLSAYISSPASQTNVAAGLFSANGSQGSAIMAFSDDNNTVEVTHTGSMSAITCTSSGAAAGSFYTDGAGGKGIAATSETGPGVWAESSGTTTLNPALLAVNNNAAGICIFSTCISSDANAVFTNKGTGDIIKGFSGGTGNDLVFRVTNDGTTHTNILQINGGSDLSEQFDVQGQEDLIRPGMVVSIDAANPGKLVVSSIAYDRKVAGILSGAGGIAPGMQMGQKGSLADGEHPVALTGRVYVWADASSASIQPGDLLTTSEVPGHAMKVSDYGRSQGAILGKAMTALDEGRGLVLVLVSLQ
jgi:hypothetical protein